MTVLTTRGFETGDTTTDWTDDTGATSYDTGVKNTGARSLKIPNGNNPTFWYGMSGVNGTTYYIRTYVYVSNVSGGMHDVISFAFSSTNALAQIKIDAAHFELWEGNGPTKVGASSANITANTWHYIELAYKATASGANEYLEARLDGTSFASNSAYDGRHQVPQRVYIQKASGTTRDLYLDDFVVQDTTWVGGLATHVTPVVDAVKTIAFTIFAPTITTTKNPTVTISNVPVVSFIDFDPNISTGTGLQISVPLSTIVFVAFDPTVSTSTGTVHITVEPTLMTMAFTIAVPTVTAESGTNVTIPVGLKTITLTPFNPSVESVGHITSVSWDGVVQSWITLQPVAGPGTGGEATSTHFGSFNTSGYTGNRTNLVRITTPPAALNIVVSTNWEYKQNAAESSNVFSLQWQGTTATSHTASGTTATVNAGTLVKAGLLASTDYLLATSFDINQNVYPLSEYVRVTSVTLEYDNVVATTVVAVTNTPAISFSTFAPNLVAGVAITVVETNVPTIVLTPYDITIGIAGGFIIGVNPVTLQFTAFAPIIVGVKNPTESPTNSPVISFAGLVPTVHLANFTLSYKLIDVTDKNSTAGDGLEVVAFDLGSMLYDQEKVFGFRIANTSAIQTDFAITATSVNNLDEMATFSTDKQTYGSSLILRQVPANAITDAIWIKLHVTTAAYVDEGTFMIHVEQTNA